MSQYWGPPSYPPPRPPQYQLPPETQIEPYQYYEPPRNTGRLNLVYFFAGSCFTLVLVGLCLLTLIVAWVLDSSLGITAGWLAEPTPVVTPAMPQQVPQPQGAVPVPVTVTPTPMVFPTTTPQISSAPFSIGMPIVASDVGLELTVLDIQRNVQPTNMQVPADQEFVAVSVKLRALNPDANPPAYGPNDFRLQNLDSFLYNPNLDADNGRLLINGPPLSSSTPEIEGDVLFMVPQGENPLFLVWMAANSSQVYTVALQ